MLLGTLENLWESQKIKKDGVFTLELQMSISTSRKNAGLQKNTRWWAASLYEFVKDNIPFLLWWENQFNPNILPSVNALDCFIWLFMNKIMEIRRGYKRVENWFKNTLIYNYWSSFHYKSRNLALLNDFFSSRWAQNTSGHQSRDARYKWACDQGMDLAMDTIA